MRKKNTKGLFLQFKIKKIKSNLEINVAQCHECLKKGPYLLKSIPTKHPHAVRPKYPYSFYGMPKSLLLDLSFVSILFVCASVHNKKIHLIYITSFCVIFVTFVVFFYRRFSCLVFISFFLVCFLCSEGRILNYLPISFLNEMVCSHAYVPPSDYIIGISICKQ